MKNTVKKIFLVLCASSVMLISTTVFATPTSEPVRSTKTISASGTVIDSGTNSDETNEPSTEDESDQDTNTTAGAAASGVVQDPAKPIPTAISTGQNQTGVVQSTEAQRAAEKKYASKGSIAVWFILSVLISAVLSFIISNRFYKLAKKDNHINAEIRALRRDLEEKFVGNVGGFSEMETDVTNTNDNYSMNGSIKMPDRKSADFAAESEDVFKRWESRMSQKHTAARTAYEEPAAEDEEDFAEEEEKTSRRKFRPSRKNPDAFEEEEAEEYGEPEEEEESKMNAVKNKAKNLLGDIFPFKED